jgi:hypothetical protein
MDQDVQNGNADTRPLMTQILSARSDTGKVPHLVAHQFGHEKCYNWLLEHYTLQTGESLPAQPITIAPTSTFSNFLSSSVQFVNQLGTNFEALKLGAKAGQFIDAPVESLQKIGKNSTDFVLSVGKDWSSRSSEYLKTMGLRYLPDTTADKEQENLFQLIRGFGYPIEHHDVLTEDGFTLRMFRIRHGKIDENVENAQEQAEQPKPVVFLQHGLFNSGCTWLVTGPKQGLAFLLADAGFDVWYAIDFNNNLTSKDGK